MKEWCLAKNSYRRRIVLILFILAFFATNAFAIPLGSASFTQHGDRNYYGDDSGVFWVAFSDEIMINGGVQLQSPEVYSYYNGLGFKWFFSKRLTVNDIGYTFAINQSNYEYWDNMIQYVLLNDSPDYFAVGFEQFDTGPWRFDWNFSEQYAGNGLGFQGYFISNLLLTIDDIWDIGYDSWIVSWTITVDGHHVPVPEPGTLLLLGSGLAGLVLYRRRMNKA